MKKNHLLYIVLIIFIAKVTVFPQSKYPADTLLTSKGVSFIKKIGILPIAGFQRISYNLNSMNCQFHPSCSNYGAEAIKQFGIIRGSFMASERIIRCNPKALESHIKSHGTFIPTNIRLIDPVVLPPSKIIDKSPLLAASFSAIIPGTGRMYAGRWFDGLMGLTQFLLYASISNYAYQNDMKILSGITGGISLIIYGGEIYGAYRTAKYY